MRIRQVSLIVDDGETVDQHLQVSAEAEFQVQSMGKLGFKVSITGPTENFTTIAKSMAVGKIIEVPG